MSNNKTNKNYAVKIIKEDNITSLEFTLKEFELIYQNKHRNIINIYGICIRCTNKNSFILYVLMDLALYDWEDEISRRRKELEFYTEKELIIILKQLISPLMFLQSEKNISHRDIKLENILIFENNIFKLCDFGEAKQKAEKNARNLVADKNQRRI
jgi:serine/threonine protein kinase